VVDARGTGVEASADPAERRCAETIGVGSSPLYIEKALKGEPRAWRHFQQLAPSYQRTCIGWIDSAKRQETKERRLREAITLLAASKKLALKRSELDLNESLPSMEPRTRPHHLRRPVVIA